MRFIKENFHNIVKLFINQIGVAIFAFFLYTAVGMIEDASIKTTLNIVVSLLSILFFCFLLYTVAWEWGAKDKIRIDGGRLKEFKAKGALISLYANVINFFAALVSFVSILIFMLSQPTKWLFDPSLIIAISDVPANFALELHTAFNILVRALSLAYNGLVRGIFSGGTNAFLIFLFETACFFVLPLLSVLATHFGYIMGLKEKKIFQSSKTPQK